MKYVNDEELLFDDEGTLDIAYGEEYKTNELITEYTTPKYIEVDKRLNRLADIIMDEAIRREATDIQLLQDSETVGYVRLRMGSEMHAHRKIHGAAMTGLAIIFKSRADANIEEKLRPQGGRFSHMYQNKSYDIRASFMPTVKGENVSLRVLYSSSLMDDVGKLGFPDEVLTSVRQVLGLSEGLILLTGGTGSGKTTTMYTGINDIMRQNEGTKNIMTIENPVEYIIEGAAQSQVDELRDYTFAKGLQVILRQNPDVILVGEINDKETAETAVRASTSGHLVFSTLHANDVLSASIAMEHYGISPFQLSWALQLVLNQKLPNKLCPHCKKTKMVNSDERKWVLGLGKDEELLSVYVAVGCDECDYFGYKGRVLVVGMLDANEAYTNIAVNNLPLIELERELIGNPKARYYPMRNDVFRHLKAGNIDLKTAYGILR